MWVGRVERQLQNLVEGLLSTRGVQHALLAVQRGRDGWRWIGTAGEMQPGGPPMQSDTPFFIASISKLFIATTVLRLHEAGRLDIDAPLVAHLSDVDLTGLHRLGGVDHTPAITLRQLLAHASGLPDYLEERARGGETLIDSVVRKGDREWTLAEVVALVRDTLRPHFPPQSMSGDRIRIRYSDTNYRLLIAVIEAVSGGSLEAAFKAEIFDPLGLHWTWLSHPEHPLQRSAATLYFGEAPLRIPLAMRAAGDLYSTADDLLRFMAALVAGELFCDAGTLPMMRDERRRFGLPRDMASLRSPSWPIEYGLGMMRFALPRLFTPLRPMPAVFGHTGSTGTWLFHCPARDLYLCGTVDQGTAGAVPFRLAPKLLKLLE